MDEDRFNLELRKFLKQVGVTSQRALEQAVRDAIAGGTLSGGETLTARVELTVDGLDLRHVVEGEIALS